ncbi:DgyrCDS5470 [Dimorphilus gyrociliatus]|uniref:protein-serine/threonine phosphatase n=1 Tax=Dimorphilus gyrociliatus TaxID=2664684 RepID=A0A7I8VKN0_9ANNE|nr:DgyrCDS5470 [Dimorphilus gyrociliatus]
MSDIKNDSCIKNVIQKIASKTHARGYESNYTKGSNFSQILPFLYMGGAEVASDTKLLTNLGISHILNCAAGEVDTDEAFYAKREMNVKYMEFCAEDCYNYDMMQHYPDAFDFIEDCRASNGKIYVHCQMGVNRSGCMVTAYIMELNKLGPIGAVQFVREHRGFILDNKEFLRQLISHAENKGYLERDGEL